MSASESYYHDQLEEEPTYPPSQNAFCLDGEEWLERKREADLEHQKKEEGNEHR